MIVTNIQRKSYLFTLLRAPKKMYNKNNQKPYHSMRIALKAKQELTQNYNKQ